MDERKNRQRRINSDCARDNIVPDPCIPIKDNRRRIIGDVTFNACGEDERNECQVRLSDYNRPEVPLPFTPPPPAPEVFLSNEVVVQCSNFDARLTGQVIVPAGEFSSTVSQPDANDLAEIEALNRLVCNYTNEQQIVTCANDYPTVSGEEQTPQGDDVIREPGFLVRTISYIENTSLFDNPSQLSDYLDSDIQGLNEDTRNDALLDLNCTFSNEEVTVNCVDDYETEEYPIVDNDPPTMGPGTSPSEPDIVIAAGEFTSSISSEIATDLAKTQALLQLEGLCLWENTTQTAECLQGTTNEGLTETVGQGLFVSTVSQSDADNLAMDLAAASLNCDVDWPLNVGGEDGAPGLQGPSGNCDESCSAVYA